MISDEYIAVVTRDSNSEGFEMERVLISVSYVTGLTVAARLRRDKRRSLTVCSWLRAGRFGVARDGEKHKFSQYSLRVYIEFFALNSHIDTPAMSPKQIFRGA